MNPMSSVECSNLICERCGVPEKYMVKYTHPDGSISYCEHGDDLHTPILFSNKEFALKELSTNGSIVKVYPDLGRPYNFTKLYNLYWGNDDNYYYTVSYWVNTCCSSYNYDTTSFLNNLCELLQSKSYKGLMHLHRVCECIQQQGDSWDYTSW